MTRRRVCARFKDNKWTLGLAEIGPLFSKSRNVKYFLCVINVLPNIQGSNLWKIKKVRHL